MGIQSHVIVLAVETGRRQVILALRLEVMLALIKGLSSSAPKIGCLLHVDFCCLRAHI